MHLFKPFPQKRQEAVKKNKSKKKGTANPGFPHHTKLQLVVFSQLLHQCGVQKSPSDLLRPVASETAAERRPDEVRKMGPSGFIQFQFVRWEGS